MDAKAKSYLMKQLVVEKNIVTYRSLSRALSIHVNLAKRYLGEYLAESDECYPQYMVAGVPKRKPKPGEDWEMEDEDLASIIETPRYKFVLVGPKELEGTKATFKGEPTVYVHNLSPAVIIDPSLIAGVPWDVVRTADIAGGSELAATVGRIVGADVKNALAKRGTKGKGKAAGSSAAKTVVPGKGKEPVATKNKESAASSTITTTTTTTTSSVGGKLKASGTLDWSKAKSKDVKKLDQPNKVEGVAKPEKEDQKGSASIDVRPKPDVESKSEEKRGQKRKTNTSTASDVEDVVPSRSSEATGKTKTTSAAPTPADKKAEPAKPTRRKNNIVISDEEEEDEHPVRMTWQTTANAKGKRRALAGSDNEDELDRMMNLDDSEVLRASKSRQATTPPDTDDAMSVVDKSEEMDVDEDVDDIPKPKRKKKEKKVVPVGKNGLKKRRVVKTRTAMDAKGFMVTEDYSEYESVDEEESEPKKTAVVEKKTKKEPMTLTSTKKAASSESTVRKPGPKKDNAAGPSKGGQQGISSFFTKKT